MDAAVRYLSERLPGVIMDNLVGILVSAAIYAVGLRFIKVIKAAAGKLFSVSLLMMKTIEAAVYILFGIFKVAVCQLSRRLVSAKNLVSLVLHLEDEIELLREQLPDLKWVISLSADAKPEYEEKRGVFRGFVEDVEDILDEFHARIAAPRLLRRPDHVADGPPAGIKALLLSKVLRCLPSSSLRLFYAKVAYKINGVYGGLERAKSHLDRRRLVDGARECLGVAGEVVESRGIPIGDEGVEREYYCFIGREAEMEQLRKEVVSEPLTKPSVVLVTGMDGIGKTVIVTQIFGEVWKLFKFVGWVHVSDELDLDVVLGSIQPRTTDDRTEIRLMLKGRRFLIVLDNLGSGRLSHWKELWDLLKNGGEGSKVVITSPDDIRQELEDISSISHVILNRLSDVECLKIFEYYAFPEGMTTSSSSERLRKIGRSIVHKIKGVPFAARMLGSSLRHETHEDVWNNVLTEVAEDGNIMPILRRNYLSLPTQLKQCMAFLSMFLRDYIFCKEHMVWMWIACGYVQTRVNERLECVGENYFNHLVKLSLLQFSEYQAGKQLYIVHDIIHDLVTGAHEAGNLISNDAVATTHQSLHEKRSSSIKKPLALIQPYSIYSNISEYQVHYARVLLFSHVQPISAINFCNMIHLRYLDLTRVRVYTLPDSICSIYHLQTLLLPDFVESFPLHTWRLPNLRHLVGGPYIRMAGIGDSRSLQTISNFNVLTGRDLEELASLKELRGKLEINHLDHVQERLFVSRAQLHNKEHIEELVLEWDHPTLRSDERQNGILQGLRPHRDLRILEINGYMGGRSPSWMGKKHLSSLVRLSLSNLHHLREMLPLGHLRRLEFLTMDDLKSVQCIDIGFYGNEEVIFPSLKEMRLKNMSALEEWKENSSIQDCSKWFPSIKLWEVSNCKDLTKIPRIPYKLERLLISKAGLKVLPDHSCQLCVRSLRELKIHTCPSLKLDNWFHNQNIYYVHFMEFCNIDKCINLEINYSANSLGSLCIRDMAALESITLINIDRRVEISDWSSTILLESLDVLKRITIVNCEDGRITAGHLKLTSVSCSQISLLKTNGSKFTPDGERTIISGNFV